MTLWWLLACQGTGTADSGATTAPPAPAWTQVGVACTLADHGWSAWAQGLYGDAQLRIAGATEDTEDETHPLTVREADPSGGWTLFEVALVADPTDAAHIPGHTTAHDCRSEGVGWSWAVDLLDDDTVVACTAWEGADTAGGLERVATCAAAK